MCTIRQRVKAGLLSWGLPFAVILPTMGRAEWFYSTNNGTITIGRYVGTDSTLVIPESIGGFPVTGIGLRAFSGAKTLTRIVIPETVTQIDGSAFLGCSSLTSVNLPRNVTTIAATTFSGCTALPGITIHDRVTSIGNSAFAGCSSLTNVSIPTSVTSIGRTAFGGCTSLTIIEIPDSVTSIGNAPMSSCTNLTEIRVDPMNPEYSSLDGVLLNKELTTLILCPGAKGGSYTIPDGVTSVGYGAFSRCLNLRNIIIPRTVTEIGDSAFVLCTGLTSMTMPESIIQIGNQVFWGCTNLGTVYFQGNIPTIYYDVFSGSGVATVYYLPGAVGWTPSFDNRPTALWIPITPHLASNTEVDQLRLVTHSPAPATIRVQRSVNLRDWEDWQTVSRDEGPSELQDPDAGAAAYRFYRGVEE